MNDPLPKINKKLKELTPEQTYGYAVLCETYFLLAKMMHLTVKDAEQIALDQFKKQIKNPDCGNSIYAAMAMATRNALVVMNNELNNDYFAVKQNSVNRWIV